MNPAANISTSTKEPKAVSKKATKRSLLQQAKLAIQSGLEAHKTNKALREAQEIRNQLREGKKPKSFEQGIKEL